MVPLKWHEPWAREALRCGHQFVSATAWPFSLRKKTMSCPMMRRRVGLRLGTLLSAIAGYQYSTRPIFGICARMPSDAAVPAGVVAARGGRRPVVVDPLG